MWWKSRLAEESRNVSIHEFGNPFQDSTISKAVLRRGPTLCPMEGSGLGPGRTLRRVGRDNDSPPQPSRHEAQKHEVHRCCPCRARYVHDSRSYTPCSQRTSAYLRAATCLTGRAQGRSPSPQMFQTIFRMSEGSFVKFAHLLSPALQKKNERYKKLYTWYLVPGIRVPGTALYVFCISRRHLLRPATPTGTFSALGWDHFPSTLAYSLRTKHNLRSV